MTHYILSDLSPPYLYFGSTKFNTLQRINCVYSYIYRLLQYYKSLVLRLPYTINITDNNIESIILRIFLFASNYSIFSSIFCSNNEICYYSSGNLRIPNPFICLTHLSLASPFGDASSFASRVWYNGRSLSSWPLIYLNYLILDMSAPFSRE